MGSPFNFKKFRNDPTEGSGGSGGGSPLGNFPLAPQSSINSWTFENFPRAMGAIGKDFGSMNVDESLKNIWSAEKIQSMGSARGAAQDVGPSVGYLQKQGSLTLPRTLSQKTVDDVWRDIIAGNTVSAEDNSGVGHTSMPQRQTSSEIMTPEEFSIRACVVRGVFPAVGSARGAAQDVGRSAGYLQKQGSLTLPRTLSQKTVDDVWRDIIAGNTVSEEDNSGVGHTSMPQRQTTLGELTLEEFLIRAGVVRAEVKFPGKPNITGIFGGLSRTWNSGIVIGYQQQPAGRRSTGWMGGRLASSNQMALESANFPFNVNRVIRSSQQQLQPQAQQIRQLQQSQHQSLFPKQPALAWVGSGVGHTRMPQRQTTLGELTLEEFLIRACVVSEVVKFQGKRKTTGSFGGSSRTWNNTAVVGYQQQSAGRRRQRRKIKIRESAERSRARKQVLNSQAVSEASVNQPHPEHSSSSSSSYCISQFRKLLRKVTCNEELISMNEPELSANPRNEGEIQSDPRNDLSSDQMEVDLQLGLSLMPQTTVVKVTMGSGKDFSSNLASGKGL